MQIKISIVNFYILSLSNIASQDIMCSFASVLLTMAPKKIRAPLHPRVSDYAVSRPTTKHLVIAMIIIIIVITITIEIILE